MNKLEFKDFQKAKNTFWGWFENQNKKNNGKVQVWGKYYNAKSSLIARIYQETQGTTNSSQLISFYKFLLKKNKKGELQRLKDIVVGDLNVLELRKNEIVRWLNKNNIDISQIKDKIIEVFGYKNFRDNYGKDFLDLFKLKTCPYCNNAYLVNIKRNNKNKSLSQFDHFYPKDKYPYLSVSLFNLIPCCANCNHNKHDNEYGLCNPYKKGLHEMIHFVIEPQSEMDFLVNGMKEEDKLKIKIIDKTLHAFASEYEKAFGLSEIYAHHKDVVQEIYWKAYIYNDTYKKELNNLFKKGNINDFYSKLNNRKPRNIPTNNIDLSPSEIDRFILGNYTNEDDFHKRPLSKLTHDIAKDLGLI